MSALPYGDVVRALRTAGNRAGAIRLPFLAKALVTTKAVEVPRAALLFAGIAAGPSADTLTARELELELLALNDSARSLALVVAPALVSLADEAAVVHRALIGIVGATSAVFGAMVPWSIAVDASLLQACRDAGWDATQLAADKDRPNELARRLARALGLPVFGAKAAEDAATSEARLRELDKTAADAEKRRRAFEQSIRSKLPRV